MSAMNGPDDGGRTKENAPPEEESAVRKFLRETGEMFADNFRIAAGLVIWLFALIIRPFIIKPGDGDKEKKDNDTK